VFSGGDLCDELITRPERSYRMWYFVVCDLETSKMRRPWPTGGCCAKKKGKRRRKQHWLHSLLGLLSFSVQYNLCPQYRP